MADGRRRRAAATATVGAGLVYGGGVLRHQGTKAANRGRIPAWKLRNPIRTHPSRALVRGGSGRVRYLTGAAMGLAGAPALAVGLHDMVRRPVKKADRFTWSQAADDLPESRSTFYANGRRLRHGDPELQRGLRRLNDTSMHGRQRQGEHWRTATRRGQLYVDANEHEYARPGIRLGGAASVSRIPLTRPRRWADETHAEMRRANKESGHTGHVTDVRPHMLRARRRHIAGRAATGAVIGAGVFATGETIRRRRVKKLAPRVVFHGTTADAAESIMRHGFRETKIGMKGPGVYTTNREKLAGQYAGKKGRLVRSTAVGPVRANMQEGGGATTSVYGAEHVTPISAEKPSRFGKADRTKRFLREGVRGTGDALHQRASSMKEAPPRAKAGPLAVATGAGLGGSLAAHRTLDRIKRFQHGRRAGTRAGITALAGATAAAASYPLARHFTSDGYEVTPAGVRRKKKRPVRPSKGQVVLDQKTMSPVAFRQGVVGKRGVVLPAIRRHTPSERAVRAKRDRGRFAKADYLGRRTPYGQQRAKIMAAGAIPIIPFAGPAAAARQAGRYAPPGQKRQAQARQLGSAAATTATGVAGAYLAAGNKSVGDKAVRAKEATARATGRVTGPVKRKMPSKLRSPGGGKVKALKTRASARGVKAIERSRVLTRAAAPLRRNPIAAGAGYLVGAKASGQIYGNIAISRNQAAQRRYDLKHPVNKLQDPKKLNRKDQRRLLEQQRRSTHTQTALASLGLAGAGMGTMLLPGVRRRLRPKTAQTIERAAIGTGLAAGGIAGVHSMRSARRSRRQIDSQLAELKKSQSPFELAQRAHRMAIAAARKGNVDQQKKMLAMRNRYMAEHEASVEKAYPKGEWIARAVRGGRVARVRAHPSGVLISYVDPEELMAREALQSERKLGVDEWGRIMRNGRPVTVFHSNIGELSVHPADRHGWADFGKAERQPLTRMHDKHAARLVRQFGDAGPLPKELNRQQRMDAYAARYVHAGGHKAEHWQRRADTADKVRTAGLAGATAGGAAMLALKHRGIRAALGHRAHRVSHAVDAATIGAATAGGAGELYAGHARRKRSSYSNAKAGVAASALRRMQDYSS